MIIACPACNTRYAVPDNAIGVEGRTVRCAKCRHSWFQDGPRIEAPPAPTPAPAPAPVAPPPPPPPPVAEPEPEPAAEAPPPPEPEAQPEPEPEPATEPEPQDNAFAEPVASPFADEPLPEREQPPVYSDDDYSYGESSFLHEPPFRARRNPAKMWMLAAILFAVVSLGALAAVMKFGLPEWVPFVRPIIAEKQEGLVLEFPANKQERRTLPDKSIYYGLAGTVRNVGTSRRSVPSLIVVFRDARNRIVHTKEVVPSKRVLAPGESIEITQAIADVPRSAKYRDVGWAPGT